MQTKEYSLEVGGRTLTATFSDLAEQANGSVMVRLGQTVVLATAVMSKNKREEIDYFPLTVEYEEKFYAAGKIGGGRFMKREGRPSDEAVLSGRIIDRTIRPLFDDYIRNEIQVVATVLSIDEDNDPDVCAVIAASLALGTSDIPWNGPVSSVRLGLKTGEEKDFIINPFYADRNQAYFDLLVCGCDDKINMIESEAKQIAEDRLASAFTTASEVIEKIQAWQKEIIQDVGKTKKIIAKPILTEEIVALFQNEIASKLETVVFTSDKGAKSAYDLRDEWLALAEEKFPGQAGKNQLIGIFEEAVNDLLHKKGIGEGKRPDGRAFDEVRNISTQAGGLSKIVHGSGIFYRGQTHVLTVLTLGGPKDSLMIDGMETAEDKFFMHHYNFPPFSVGETGRMGGVNRRSVGHGALAEKSLRGIIPDRDVFPYTIRLVSEVMSSNGSSSMGSVCGSTLALMDGGVPIKAPVAGIAMGLLMDDKGAYKILTDIQGPEDHYGDMDFKVAGTAEGVTGIQLDIKVGGIPTKILIEAITDAKKARLHILEKIKEAIATPRPEIAPSAPKITKISISPEKIGSVIGPGGKNIQKICADTNTQIEIEDDGTVYITGKIDGVNEAREIVEDIAREYKVGDRFEGEVTRMLDFGAFVKIGRDTEGLIHISELAPFRVDRVTDVVQIGDQVPVVVKEVDEKGRVNLSLKMADPDYATRKGAKPSTNPPLGGNGGPRRDGPRPHYDRPRY